MEEKATYLSKDIVPMEALNGSIFLYRSWSGKTLGERHKSFNDFIDLKKINGVHSYQRTLTTKVNPIIKIAHTWADEDKDCLNFGSQDYLGLGNHAEIKKTAHETIDKYGLNAGGSPVLSGKNSSTLKLERKIAEILGTGQTLLFSSGWMACFGAVVGLVSHKDTIVMDMFSHNSLDVGAKYATDKVYKFKHNSVEDLEKKLERARKDNPSNGLFVIIESLYSMNADSPDVGAMLALVEKYEAIMIIDICHDFGNLGTEGLGALENSGYGKYLDRLVIVGSLSKTLVTTGGFISGPRCIRTQLEGFAPSYTFATAISPLNCEVAHKALEICFSEEGKQLRDSLKSKAIYAIDILNKAGFITSGVPCAIVPVLIGDVRLARLVSRDVSINGLSANLVEFPAVPIEKSLIRLQLMENIPRENIAMAVEILSNSIKASQTILIDSQINAI
jgi:7-keto-8-aminopelargonate synthetase-like enzyme